MATVFFGNDAHHCPGSVRSVQGTARVYSVSDKPHMKTRFAKWNIGRFAGKSKEVTDVMQRRRNNVLCI